MSNLIIGSTSQISAFLPADYVRVSSRNLNIDTLKIKWNKVYITFAKQNVFDKTDADFSEVNTYYTLDIVKELLDYSDSIFIFTTCEMFNDRSGLIYTHTSPSFRLKDNDNYNNYIISKYLLYKLVTWNRKKDKRWNKVRIIHPFSFESSRKSNYFLFGKISESIINKKRIHVGNLDFYRDMVHTSHFCRILDSTDTDTVIGSGKLFNVKEAVLALYNAFDMSYKDWVIESNGAASDRFIRAGVYNKYHLDDFISDFVEDIKLRLQSS